MSQLPRPYSKPSRSVSLKGSLSQFWPSTGTTSVWPDNTMPPWVLPASGPCVAGSVANRLALVRSLLCANQGVMPCACKLSRTVVISSRLELRLVVSKATSFSSHCRVFILDSSDYYTIFTTRLLDNITQYTAQDHFQTIATRGRSDAPVRCHA